MSPRPPPPTVPAIAEYPKMVPKAMVAPVTSEVLASTSMTRKITSKSEAPMDLAASITPLSTSFSEDSTNLPIYGAAEMTSGTIVAVDP